MQTRATRYIYSSSPSQSANYLLHPSRTLNYFPHARLSQHTLPACQLEAAQSLITRCYTTHQASLAKVNNTMGWSNGDGVRLVALTVQARPIIVTVLLHKVTVMTVQHASTATLAPWNTTLYAPSTPQELGTKNVWVNSLDSLGKDPCAFLPSCSWRSALLILFIVRLLFATSCVTIH